MSSFSCCVITIYDKIQMGRGRGVGWEWSSGCDCMEVRFSFIASNGMSWYLSHSDVYSIYLYVIKFVSDLWPHSCIRGIKIPKWIVFCDIFVWNTSFFSCMVDTISNFKYKIKLKVFRGHLWVLSISSCNVM